MAPTLAQAKHRKWWIAITAVIENLTFAAVLLGWSSLLLMLKKEGFYSNLCIEENENGTLYNTTSPNATSPAPVMFTSTNSTPTESEFQHPTCAAQDEILNRYFSIGSSLLSAVTVVLGIIMDKYGSRVMRMVGCWTFMLSCACFAIGSLDTDRYSFLMAPAVCLNGMGGIVYVFTSFQIPNLFENIRSTMIALMIGSYSASAVIYMLFKAAYDTGIPFAWLMMFHAILGFFTFINCYMNIPQEPLPGPDDITYAIKFNFGDLKFDHKISGKQFLHHTSSVGRRMSSIDIDPLESLMDISKNKNSSQIDPFIRVIVTPCVLWSFLTISLTQLRLIAYMGWMEMYFKAAADLNELDQETKDETVEKYTFIFGLLQVNCFFMAPIIGTIMDWKLKLFKNEDVRHNGKDRKGQIIWNLMMAFGLTNLLMVTFGIIIMFEKCLPLQVVAFVMHTAIRTFLHSSLGGLYACMYHFSHFGKLTGLSSFLSALFILIQDPLFVVINNSLGGDPFWINLGLLILSISGFGLPIYLFIYGRKYTRQLNLTDAMKKKAEKLDAIAEEEDDDDEPAKMNGNGYHVSDKNLNKEPKDLEEEQALHLSISAITF
ncbi:large neutral amino acids transporter small subunit 4-like [Styela clava]